MTGDDVRKPAARPWAAGVAVLLLIAVGAVLLLRPAAGTRVIHERDSPFGAIRVTENASGVRTLYTGEGRARQSVLDPDRPRHLELAYTRVAMVGLALVPPDARMLFVGLGGGAMPTYAHHVRPAARIDVVEIDPDIIDVARLYFGFRDDALLSVHAGDGRAFIEAAPPGSWDLIVLDAFSDDAIPYALATRTFLAAVHDALAPGGIVIANLWGANPLYPSMLATYDAVFDDAQLIQARGRQRILVASAGRQLDRQTLVEAAHAFTRHADPGFDLLALVERGWEPRAQSAAPVLEDSASLQLR